MILTAILAAAIVAIALTLAELAGLTHVAAGAATGRVPSFGATLAFLAGRSRSLLAFSARLLARLALLTLPLVAIAAVAWFGWLGAHDINYYLAERPVEWQRSLWLIGLTGAACAIEIALQLARWLYVLPILVLKSEATAQEAMAESLRLTRGRLWPLIRPLMAWWLLVAVVAGACLWAGVALSASWVDWAGMDIRRLLPVVGLCLATTTLAEFTLSGLGLAGQQFQLTSRYLAAQPGLRVAAADLAAPAP